MSDDKVIVHDCSMSFDTKNLLQNFMQKCLQLKLMEQKYIFTFIKREINWSSILSFIHFYTVIFYSHVLIFYCKDLRD